MKPHFALTILLLVAAYANPAAERHAARGLVIKVNETERSILISCEEIPAYMSAMVMLFEVHNASELKGLTPGTIVEFTVVAAGSSAYLEGIHVRRYESAETDPLTAQRLKLITQLSEPNPTAALKPGDAAPNFTLVDQTGKSVTLSDFRGKVVLITFTYTHCALPNFCFRIANHFRQVQAHFADRLGRDLVLMTITFDPTHDTPEVMAKYGETWHANPQSWHLLTGEAASVAAVGKSYGISFWADEGLMNHSLHTFVVDRSGELVADLEGNEYTDHAAGGSGAIEPGRPRRNQARGGRTITWRRKEPAVKIDAAAGQVRKFTERVTTVLLVDDHAVVRRGFRRVLEDEPGIVVVGEAGDGDAAIEMSSRLKPTVVLMDCSLPGTSGLAAAKQIVKLRPETAVLMCSMHSEELWVKRAMEAGARGYVFKSATDLDLPAAIKHVAAGHTLFSSQAALNQGGARKFRLSLRETEVLRLIVNGKTSKEIAAQLKLSQHTVEVHRANIMKSLGIHKTAELVAYAVRNGLA